MSSVVTTHSRRPIGVTLIAIVQLVNALTLGIELAVLEEDPATPYTVAGDPGLGAVAFIVLGLASSFGLWTLRRWAWVTTMLWAGFVLLASLLAYFRDEPVSYFTMAVTLLQVFYLNLTEVQRAFETSPDREASVG
jgi:hypothetical protein